MPRRPLWQPLRRNVWAENPTPRREPLVERKEDAMRLRCCALSLLLAGLAPLARAQTPILEWQHSATHPIVTKLSWDTEGRGNASRNLLRPEGLRLSVSINGSNEVISTAGIPTTPSA